MADAGLSDADAAMTAGNYDRIIELFKQGAPFDDGYTTQPGGPESQGTRKARLLVARAREIFENAGPEVERPYVFEVRFDSLTRQIDETWSLGFEGRSFNIKSVAEIGRRVGIRIEAVAGD